MIVTVAEFKSKCLELKDSVNRTGEVVTITKRGRIVAELRTPYGDAPKYSGPGFAKGELIIVGDIIEPIDVEWEAMQ
jgi:antitoxin (DNA-binding transcriptional repressor) of toxin-antitoxin stability system